MFTEGFVHLYTEDIEAALHFWADLLGFEETFRTPTDGVPSHVELAIDGFGIGLGSVEAARQVHGIDPRPGAPSMSIVLWCDDVDETYEQLTAAGVRTLQAPHDTGNRNRNALLSDPDGNLVEIVSKRS